MVTRRTLLMRSALIVGCATLPRGPSIAVAQPGAWIIRRCVVDGTLDLDGYYCRSARAAGMRVDEFQRDVGALSMQ